jgi:fructose-1,6-bisphosphatase II / sedoheptulose-1,7-bisphosphatase
MTAKMHAASADGHHGPARAGLDRISSAEIAAVTERAAVAAARHCGHDDETTADRAAVDAMRHALNQLPIRGRVVIGEGERNAAPMLFIGEEVGNGTGQRVDIAVDPLEGTTLAARNMPGALTVMAWAEPGALLYAPDVYMEKIAIGPGYRQASSISICRRRRTSFASPAPRARGPMTSRRSSSAGRATRP